MDASWTPEDPLGLDAAARPVDRHGDGIDNMQPAGGANAAGELEDVGDGRGQLDLVRAMRSGLVNPDPWSRPSPLSSPAGALVLRGSTLRALLTLVLDGSPQAMTVAALVAAVRRHGFELSGRPTRVVSDALRVETSHGRVTRVGWGLYARGHITKQYRHRLRKRLAAARHATRSATVQTRSWPRS